MPVVEGSSLTSVVVLDGNENQAVACVRDLAAAGFRVVAGDSTWPVKAAWSRHASGRFTYASPRSSPARFVDDMLRVIARQPGRVVILPMTEGTTMVLSAHRDALQAAGAVVPLPSAAVLAVAFDKTRTSAIAASAGIRVPTSMTFETTGELDEIIEFPMPAVVKARSSNASDGDATRQAPRPRYATTALEVRQRAREFLERGHAVLVQEFVEGEGVGYFALCAGGRVLREFAHRRIRDFHPTGSGSSFRESIAMPSALGESCRRMLEQLAWDGPVMIEFKRTPSGELVFLEVNGRLWNSLALAVDSGALFPRWWVRQALSMPLGEESPYRVGVRVRWLLGDVHHTAKVLRGRPAEFPGRFPGRLHTVRDVLRGWTGSRLDNFRLNDPLPELGDWVNAVRKAIGKDNS
jgi:predicted ATP-grasp superfamily ATP-dependent carboligase